MTQRLLNLFRCINNTWKKCRLLVIWEPVEILQIERLQINRPPNRPTDAEVEQAIKARFAQSRKILDVREKYYNEFRKFLSPKQIQKMYNMEKHNGDKFRKEMRKRQGMKKQHDGEDICHRAM